uniref:MHC class I-like antigen recognition-like domain-containing protein n=1 Tax=Neolamprologus brichardi TaxID=32507 RepID=A0A3Q4GKD8_NEOBR
MPTTEREGLLLCVYMDDQNHSLTYIYTGLSKPVGLPGIHEFTAMGLLDDKMIDYFDSENQAKIPKQEWMKTCVPENYWKEGTQSRKNKLQWFKESINILMQQMGQNDSVLHVLQWMVGCEVEMQPGGKLKFLQGFWKYNYDGDDFLYLDNKGQEWGAVNYVAELTKRKWDHYWNAKGYTKNYLENTCIDWLSNLLNCGQQQLRNTSAPEVYAIKKEAKVKTNITLICLVTGFYQKDIIMRIKRNEYILTEKDGLISSGVVPNGDETSQRKVVTIREFNLSSMSWLCPSSWEMPGTPHNGGPQEASLGSTLSPSQMAELLTLSLRERPAKLQKAHFCHLYLSSLSFSHYSELLTIGETKDIE